MMEAMEKGNGEAQELVRVKCMIPEVPCLIDGIWWGRVGTMRVSEPIPSAKAQRLLGIEGFGRFNGTPEEAADADADIAKSRQTASPSMAAEANAKLALEQMNAANQRLSSELVATHQRLEAAEADNVKLRQRLVQLGARPAPIGQVEPETEPKE